jgi:membrane associated rhomboid family serine protease
MLVHADWTHLIFNMFTFYSFGTFMEKVFISEGLFESFFPELSFWGYSSGQLFFVMLYVLGGAFATLPSLRKHGDNYGYNAVGASGAVSAVMMAFMIMFPTFEISFFLFIPMPAWIGALVFLGLEHYLSRNQRSNIAHDAHIWGALFGVLFVIALNPRFLGLFVEKVLATLPF